MDYGYVPRFDTPENTIMDATDAVGFTPRRLSKVSKDPVWEDILIAYATVPGFVANRNINRGTWFIESICQVRKYYHSLFPITGVQHSKCRRAA